MSAKQTWEARFHLANDSFRREGGSDMAEQRVGWHRREVGRGQRIPGTNDIRATELRAWGLAFMAALEALEQEQERDVKVNPYLRYSLELAARAKHHAEEAVLLAVKASHVRQWDASKYAHVRLVDNGQSEEDAA